MDAANGIHPHGNGSRTGTAEVAVLEAWYRHKIDNGAAWFAMPVLTENGMTETNVRFSEPYQVAMQGHDLYEITCNLEIDEMPMMSEEELDLVIGGDADGE